MKLSILGISRKRSKFLAKFLASYVNLTNDQENTELLMMVSKDEDWNTEIIEHFRQRHGVKFFFEDWKLGGRGRHVFFNELAMQASGEWMQHACDDHLFVMKDWDEYIRASILHRSLDPLKVHVIIPKFSNTGSCAHLLSRGYLAVLGKIGGCGNIDSWINSVLEGIPQERITHLNDESIMFDHSAHQEILAQEYLHPIIDTSEGDKHHLFGSGEISDDISQAISKLKHAISNGL